MQHRRSVSRSTSWPRSCSTIRSRSTSTSAPSDPSLRPPGPRSSRAADTSSPATRTSSGCTTTRSSRATPISTARCRSPVGRRRRSSCSPRAWCSRTTPSTQRLRRLVNRAFTPQLVKSMTDDVDAVVTRHLDRIADTGNGRPRRGVRRPDPARGDLADARHRRRRRRAVPPVVEAVCREHHHRAGGDWSRPCRRRARCARCSSASPKTVDGRPTTA